ncbi:recombinase family protein [Cohnella herbarum]|uniref:Recombinase family protein n=1 Tax=Cohnella herbarum TaxID=2728023 RepID=A0A7Z2ZQD2_9BACL|nr:recombinase family protein [Cohnella herbarum]QJD87875.1 recombinase family protein [Cohnella herbarum]
MYGQLPPGDYGAYLRKSRVDLEAESRGDEDTYAKHKRVLFDLAKRHNITISKIYQEKPISGERISERPDMMSLLSDVDEGKWTGILVVEVERLARGDTMDQGIVAQAFKYSNTLIVTPMRTFDPNNADDEEYFEFGLYMSRREFKTINRRQQNGRKTAVAEGKYIGNIAPYGYDRKKLPGKGWTLEINPEQAPIIELIFNLYNEPDPEKRMGTARIARYLNEVLKVPTMKNSSWTVATVNGILRNPTYIGNVKWGTRPVVRKRAGKSRPRLAREDTTEEKGLHPAIISEEVFERTQELLRKNNHPRTWDGKVTNPLASLVRCAICGSTMIGRPYKNGSSSLMCIKPNCPTVSTYIHIVEERILDGLKIWLDQYSKQWDDVNPAKTDDELKLKVIRSSIEGMRKKLVILNEQKNEQHNLLERKIYDLDTYMTRSIATKKEIDEIENGIITLEEELSNEGKRIEARSEVIPQVTKVIELYPNTEDPSKRNELLKSVLEMAVYKKDVGGRWSGLADQFELILQPKLSE